MNEKLRCAKCLEWTEPGLEIGDHNFCEECVFVCFPCGRTLPTSEIDGVIDNDPACFYCLNPRYYE